MKMRRKGNFQSMEQIKKANQKSGYHFFDPSNMRFFNSKIHTKRPIRGCVFITSEQYDYSAPRLYTIRIAYADGSIETMKWGFQKFQTYQDAEETALDFFRDTNCDECPFGVIYLNGPYVPLKEK
tara:strand:- start:68 stop:442 length:375 start_codon:yes stop_codon:yes gene_type:complete